MATYRLTRAGAVDLVFEGECLADVSSRDGSAQQRWSEVRIYRTASGRYVTGMTGRSVVPGEVDRIDVKVVERAEEIGAALSRRGNDRNTVNPGDPNRPYLTELALEAMALAGEQDDAIAAVLVERV